MQEVTLCFHFHACHRRAFWHEGEVQPNASKFFLPRMKSHFIFFDETGYISCLYDIESR